MDAMSYAAVRKNFANTMEKVCNDHEPLIVTRKNSRAIVMMSLEDYNAIQQTAYLLNNAVNANALRTSIQEYEAGKIYTQDIIEE